MTDKQSAADRTSIETATKKSQDAVNRELEKKDPN